MRIKLREPFADPSLNVMNFLSEVTRDFPDSISFATGSPMEALFNVEDSVAAITRFVQYRAESSGTAPSSVFSDLGQYNRTNGIITDLIARHLALDEEIHVPPEAVMVTSGSQEAMAILVMGLFDTSTDVLLVSDPTYIGITGIARVIGVPVIPVPLGEAGLDVDILSRTLEEVRRLGKRPRALYEIPDFNNPLGTSLPLSTRHELLGVAREHDLLIIEDNPYGMFAYEGARLPTLKALDSGGSVIYLGTFSKTLFPGLRIGYMVADQQVEGGNHRLAEELSKVKSFSTVNTSPLLQAAVGGLLLGADGSLQPFVESKIPFYRANRDRMLARLTAEFGEDCLEGRVHWNCPHGGFFLTLRLPFVFDTIRFRTCASEYGVLCCPMSYFSLRHVGASQVRLSFSYVTTEQIDEGIRRLAFFVRDQLGH